MTILTIIIAITLSIAIFIASVTAYRLFKLNKLQSQKIAGLQTQLSALCAGAMGTDTRILKFEQTLSTLKEQNNTLALATTSSPQSYEHAIRLARKGAGVEQLIDNCNLSSEEAHLISRLHGNEYTTTLDLH